MTPTDLRNIHTTRKSWRNVLPCTNMALKLPGSFTCCWRSLLVATSKFGLLTIRWHSAARKHLFLYPQGDRSGLGKPKKDKHHTNQSYHQRSSPYASLNLSNNKARISFKQPNRKRWGAKLVDVKHLPQKTFLL